MGAALSFLGQKLFASSTLINARCKNISCCTSVAAVQSPIIRRTDNLLWKRMTTIYVDSCKRVAGSDSDFEVDLGESLHLQSDARLAVYKIRIADSFLSTDRRCDDINYYGRTVAVHDLLKGREYNQNKAVEGFDKVNNSRTPRAVHQSGYADVLLRPTMVGILRCGKMLPPQLNLVIEIEFADATTALWSENAGPGGSHAEHRLRDPERPSSGLTGRPGLCAGRVLQPRATEGHLWGSPR